MLFSINLDDRTEHCLIHSMILLGGGIILDSYMKSLTHQSLTEAVLLMFSGFKSFGYNVYVHNVLITIYLAEHEY